MRNLRVVAFFLLLSMAAQAVAAIDTASLDRAFDVLARNERLRGSVAVMKDGKVLYRRAIGAGIDHDTRMRIGSITKVFTAAMVYQLIDEKKLTLETKLERFFPQLPNANQITIAHLLGHTSGIPQFPAGGEPWATQPQSREQFLARLAALPVKTPGERAYSNANFVLLGNIVESITRSTYEQQLQKRIVRKLRLKRTRYGAIDPSKNEAHSFTYDESKWTQQPETHWSIAGGAGGIASTPTDLATFISALFTNEQVLREASIVEMIRDKGKGINVHTLSAIDKQAYSHLGGIDGFSANLLYIPEDRVAFAITLNGQNYPMNKVFWLLADAYYGRPLAMPSFEVMKLSEETLASFEGTWSIPEVMDIVIRRDGEQLTAQATGQDAFPIHAIGDALFNNPPSGILIEFKGDSFTLYQGRNAMRFTKTKSSGGS